MKQFLILLSILFSNPIFAESVKTVVGTFNGALSIEPGLDIKKIEVEVVNQFCTLLGNACAGGGPREEENLPIIIDESKDGRTYKIVHDSPSEISTLKLGSRFSSCKVALYIEGINAQGKAINGFKGLAFMNDKKACGSKDVITKLIRDNLTAVQIIKDKGSFISIE